MITLKNIETAVAKLLKKNKYTVIASEVKEGFDKPSCFIEILPVSIEIQNQFTELVKYSVEITYYPEIETKEELLITAEKMHEIFITAPLKVKDRYLTVNELVFDKDNSSLTIYFELEFLQETGVTIKSMPKMMNVESVVKEGNGSSKDTD